MIRAGTCSWTEKSLIKSKEFYPPPVRTAEDRLKYYSSVFDTVEVDSTYYAIPERSRVEKWAERTPEDFIFNVKVYSALTFHGTEVKTIPKDLAHLIGGPSGEQGLVFIKDKEAVKALALRFVESISPLAEARKLGALLFQFPPWFRYSKENLDGILFYRSIAGGLPMAVEFRHGSWLTPQRAEEVFSFLENNSIAYVTADEPQYGSLATIPFMPRATAEAAYFRFHGRNKDNWLKKGIETSLRYDYFYSDEELKSFIPALVEVDKKVKTTYAMFNNCHGGFAVKDAVRLKELLKGYGGRRGLRWT